MLITYGFRDSEKPASELTVCTDNSHAVFQLSSPVTQMMFSHYSDTFHNQPHYCSKKFKRLALRSNSPIVARLLK